jgi:hypothetical protein
MAPKLPDRPFTFLFSFLVEILLSLVIIGKYGFYQSQIGREFSHLQGFSAIRSGQSHLKMGNSFKGTSKNRPFP